MTAAERRFWSKVHISSDASVCWEWMCGKFRDGYGKFRHPELGSFIAHRMAYLSFYGSLPSHLLVCHSCDNPSCCNPYHLWLGTSADNLRDMIDKGRAAWQRSKSIAQ